MKRPASAIIAESVAEARDRFPVWFTVWISIGHTLTGMLIAQPARPSSLLTLAMPLSWAVAYHVARRDRPSWPALALLTLSAPLVAFVLWLPARSMYDGSNVGSIKVGFEILAPIWVALLAWHCRRERGWRGVAAFFGLAAVYGFILESSGISLGYFTEPGYRVYVPFSHTPVAAVAGWTTMFYPSVYIIEGIGQRLKGLRYRPLLSAAAVTVVALFADLHFDPIATALGMWVWNPRLPAVWLGVPLVNFTSWFAAVFAVALAYFLVTRREMTPRARALAAVAALPLALALSAPVNLALIAAIEGTSGPAWSIYMEAMRQRLP